MRAASIIVAVASLAFAPGAAAAGPQIVDVGTGILPEALNSSDMIVGISTTTQPDGEAFPAYWQNGAAGDLPHGGYLGDPHFPATDVNDAGRIAGALDVGTICDTCTQISHALYWPSPTSAPVDLGAFGESQGINTAGDVVGRHGGAGGNNYAFVAPQGGTPIDVGAMNGDILAINDQGTALGINSFSNGLWSLRPNAASNAGTPITLTAALRSHPLANDGAVIGTLTGKSYIRLPDGTQTQIPGMASPEAVNSAHTVVGEQTTNKFDPAGLAMIYKDGVTSRLDSLLPPGSGWVLRTAEDINENGDVTGIGSLNGVQHAYLLKTGLTLSGTVTFRGTKPSPASGITVRVTGSNINPRTVMTAADGRYSVELPAGTYQVSLDSKLPSHAVASADCAAKDQVCTVTLDHNRSADFVIDCETDTVDFKTSMIATGCFVPGDTPNKMKAKGSFRLDGIDFKSLDDTGAPVVFDTEKKTVDGTAVNESLSAAGGWGSGWFAWQVPGGLHLSFPYSVTRHTWVMRTPVVRTGNPFANAFGVLQFGGLADPTMFGFPAHAPALELEFTPGRTSVTVQLSLPTRRDAFLDPINGLWKVPTRSGSTVNYPNAMKAKISASNADGVDFIEGTLSPAAVYGLDTAPDAQKRLILGAKGAPASSVLELAKIHIGWELAKGVVHAGATFVIHGTDTSAARKALGDKSFFFGQTIADTDVSWVWTHTPQLFGRTWPIPAPVHISLLVQSIHKIVPPLAEAFIFWERFGLKGGVVLSSPKHPLELGVSAGFTWLPRFKHDFLWFQEFASLDVAGTLQSNPLGIIGTADLKVIGANVLHGALSLSSAGLDLSGDSGLDFNQIIRTPIPLSFRGLAHLAMPSGAPWQLGGAGKAEVWKFNVRGDLIWNADGIGFCATAGALKGKGIYFDGATHQGGCEGGPFASGTSAGVFSTGAGPPSGGGGKGDADDVASAGVAKAQVAKTPTFRVTTRSRLSGVAIRGRGGAPHVRVTGPGGLSLAVDQTNTTARSGDTILILNPGDKTTYLSFQHARVGTYRITTLPGSPPLRWARFSAKLAAPRVGASVNAAGCAERLTWHVKPLPGQSVQFIERIKGAPDRLLKNTAKASGSLTFTPQTSTVASRTVLAQVIQQGTPRTTITVARFHAITGNPPAKVRGLKGKRTGRKVALRWAPVCGAVGYLISTAVGKNTAQVTSAKTHLTVNAGKIARISVAAGGFAGALGRAATIKVR